MTPRQKAVRMVARELCREPGICQDCLTRADMLITTYESARQTIDGAVMSRPRGDIRLSSPCF